MGDLYVALLTIFGTIESVSGIVLYVFNGTRKLIREMHETIREMHETQKDIVELSKTGFGDLSRDIGEIKSAIKK